MRHARHAFLATLFAGSFALAFAQPLPPPPPIGNITEIAAAAAVTPAQKEKFASLLAAHEQAVEKLRRTAGLQEKSLRDTLHTDLAALLSGEQLAKLDAWMADHRPPAPPVPPSPPPVSPSLPALTSPPSPPALPVFPVAPPPPAPPSTR